MAFDRPNLGRINRKRKSNTCFNCRREIIRISKIHIKGPKFLYHCEACKEAAEEEAKELKKYYGVE